MNSSDSTEATDSDSAVTTFNRKSDNIPETTNSSRIHFCGPFLRQEWFFPDSIIYYITKYPSSTKIYQKIIKCCKYFFANNPILVIERFVCYDKYDRIQRIHTIEKFILDNVNVPNVLFTNSSFKFWITDYAFFGRIFSPILPRLYQVNAKYLRLTCHDISFDEFKFLSSNVEEINLHYTVVVLNENGSIVPLEKLVEILPKIKKIAFFNNPARSSITVNTVKEFLKIPHFLQIEECNFFDMTDLFHIENFFAFLKKTTQTKLRIYFSNTISVAFQNRAEVIVDEIIQTKNHEYLPPMVEFQRLLFGEKYFKMLKLHRSRIRQS